MGGTFRRQEIFLNRRTNLLETALGVGFSMYQDSLLDYFCIPRNRPTSEAHNSVCCMFILSILGVNGSHLSGCGDVFWLDLITCLGVNYCQLISTVLGWRYLNVLCGSPLPPGTRGLVWTWPYQSEDGRQGEEQVQLLNSFQISAWVTFANIL